MSANDCPQMPSMPSDPAAFFGGVTVPKERPSIYPSAPMPVRGEGTRHRGDIVHPTGSKAARYVLVGEAPGPAEDIVGENFVGPSGTAINRYLRDNGMSRSEWYIDNVYQFYPGKSGIKKVSKEDMERAVDALHERIAALEDPWIIVPTGNYALKALTNGKCDKITKWRGSMLEYEDRKGRKIKVIPTIHPAALMRDEAYIKATTRDWKLIGEERHTRGVTLPVRNCNIDPTLADIDAFIAELEANPNLVLAVDIETPKKPSVSARRILCFGFSTRPDFALVVPTMIEHWRADGRGGKKTLEEEVWPRVRKILTLPNPKVGHNFQFDLYWIENWLGEMGARKSWRFDTLAMHHCLDPIAKHGLGYCASVDTTQQYWKDDAKDFMANSKAIKQAETLFRYNALDAMVTIELHYKYWARILERKLEGLFEKDYRRLFPVVLDMMAAGYRQDIGKRESLLIRLVERNRDLDKELTAMNGGEPLTGTKGGLSNQKVAAFLYGRLAIDVVRDRGTGRVTTDEVALRRIARTHEEGTPEKKAAALLLERRRNTKTSERLPTSKLDPDGYERSSYSPTTDSGRVRASASPFGSGANSMNVDRRMRYVYLPDVVNVLLELDACVDGWTPVLMADGTQRNAGEDIPTDIQAFDEHGDYALRRATVTNNKPLLARCVKINFGGVGESVICSTNHRWLVHSYIGWVWKSSAELSPGDHIRHVDGSKRVNSIVPVGIRYVYPVSNTAHTFIAAGLYSHNSQIQDRTVKALTKAPRLLEIARCPPGEGPDTHTELAKLIVAQSRGESVWETFDPAMRKHFRQIAKSGRYLDTFDGQDKALCEWLEKMGVYVSLADACKILKLARSTMPEYTDWHRSVRTEIMSTGMLKTSCGHTWDVRHLPLKSDLYREGYAWLAQRFEASIMLDRGLGYMHEWLAAHPGHGRINGFNHDAVIFSCPVERVWEVARAMRDSMEQKMDINGEWLIPWCEFKIGRAWGDEPERPELRDHPGVASKNTKDWKRLPSKEEMTEAAMALVR